MFFNADSEVHAWDVMSAVDKMIELGAPLEMLFEKARSDERFATYDLVEQVRGIEDFDEYFSEIANHNNFKQFHLLRRLKELRASDKEIIERFEDCDNYSGSMLVSSIDDISLIEKYLNHPSKSARSKTIFRLLKTGRDYREFNIDDFDFRCFDLVIDDLYKKNDFEGLRKIYKCRDIDAMCYVVERTEDIDFLIDLIDDDSNHIYLVISRLKDLRVTKRDLNNKLKHNPSDEFKTKIMILKERL